MPSIVKNFCLIPALAAVGVGAERREKVAHGVSRGIAAENRTSPGGASEKKSHSVSRLCGLHVRLTVSPLAGLDLLLRGVPTADAVGYRLAPLRGCILALIHSTRMNPRAQNVWLIRAL